MKKRTFKMVLCALSTVVLLLTAVMPGVYAREILLQNEMSGAEVSLPVETEPAAEDTGVSVVIPETEPVESDAEISAPTDGINENAEETAAEPEETTAEGTGADEASLYETAEGLLNDVATEEIPGEGDDEEVVSVAGTPDIVGWLRPGATNLAEYDTAKTGKVGSGVYSQIYTYQVGATSYRAVYLWSYSDNASLDGQRIYTVYQSSSEYQNVTDIIMDDTITKISTEGMFAGLPKVSHVRLSANLESFSQKLFENCTSLTDITIPKTLVSAVGNTFWGCSQLKTITFEDGIRKIPDNVASDGDNGAHGSNLRKVYIPSSVTEIGECAFLYQYYLEKVVFMDPANTTLSHIGRKAFCDTNLSGIDLPKFGGEWKDSSGKHHPAIGTLAFGGIRNTAFKTFIVPEGVVSIYEIWQNNHWKYVYLPSTLQRSDDSSDTGLLQAFFYAEPNELDKVYYNGSRSQFFTKTLGKNTTKIQDGWIDTLGNRLTFTKVVFNTPAPAQVSKLTPPPGKSSILKYYDEISEPNQATINLTVYPADHMETEYRVESSDESVVSVGSPVLTDDHEVEGKLPILISYHKKIGEATITVTGGLAKTEIKVVIKEKAKIDPPTIKVVGGEKVYGSENTYKVKYGDWILAESDTRDCSFYYQIGTSGTWQYYPNGLRVGTEIFGGDKSDVTVKAKVKSANEYLLDSDESIGINLKYEMDWGEVTEYDLGGSTSIPSGMWIPESSYNEDQYYTGSAVTCKDLKVFYYNKLLHEGKDYTVKYYNNVNTPAVSGETPSFTVIGKGNYNGHKISGNFVIKQVKLEEINEADVDYVPVTLIYKEGKAQKANIGLKVNGRKLILGTDYELIYSGDSTTVTECGKYNLHVRGIGNYTGDNYGPDVAVYVVNPAVSVKMESVTVSKIKDQSLVAVGTEVEPEVPTVKYKGKTLQVGSSGACTVEYRQNTAAGTAKAIIRGTGNPVDVGGKQVNFMGAKTVTFNIKPISIANAIVSGVEERPYAGSPWTQYVTVKLDGKTLTEDKDYCITYKNNVKPGTATMILTGKGNYGGTKKETFEITKAELTASDVSELSYDDKDKESFYYTKGGVRPKVEVCLPGGENPLTTKDYTITYKNNTEPGPEYAASVTISGKRYVIGSVTINFTIEKGRLDLCETTFADKVYAKKGGIYKQKPKIKDTNGKILNAGTDYESEIAYSYKEDTNVEQKSGKSYVTVTRPSGSSVDDNDIIPAGTTIEADISPKGNYDNHLIGYFRIGKKNISSAKLTIPTQEYTGYRVLPGTTDIKGLDRVYYEIISYGSNIKQGTGTVTVRGLGDYIGTKTIKFRIK